MSDESALADEDIPLADALLELHARDDNGRIHVGVDAFLLIWRKIPRWRVAAAVAGFAPVGLAMRAAYPVFARWRFARLAHCQIAKSSR
jgi:predicted DCC family thiol-disulfide oxidoreductase YuxK